jgi:chemotaxis protein methyltransferase CheR
MSETSAEDLAKFINVMKSHTPYDFSDYSDKSLSRRLSKLLFDNNMSLTELLDKITTDKEFVEKIVKDVTVNTSEMFRDPQVWQALRQHVLPHYQNRPLNIWHAGCSTGQEVYTVMIILHAHGMLDNCTIYATDLNEDVLENARKGIFKYRFNQNYIQNYEAVMHTNPATGEKLAIDGSKYFEIDKSKDIIKINDSFCKKVIYRKHDLVKDHNIFDIQFDLIFCRNVIIYFNTNLQNKVFNLFYNSLDQHGCMLLGLHETILGPFSGNFEKRDHFFYYKKQHS